MLERLSGRTEGERLENYATSSMYHVELHTMTAICITCRCLAARNISMNQLEESYTLLQKMVYRFYALLIRLLCLRVVKAVQMFPAFLVC
jgi:hypothetical protein